ncbi:helix-turn-helix domain-containing protein [Sphingobacterium hungaricum]|uniref:Transcriptional regulator n=1 Tax=Sphingobacterium hungaricum TaxID=2082723 RepID=A0A928YQY6_9SPHI|nr:helix-turn-helix transcriptional regulator [Sphingobacterium hungaricum]MBE8714434.1 transcriptional regulator [Sphingobacterium hungaricum]
MNSTIILNKIRALRKQNKLSQTDMAENLFIALKTYQNIENGVTKIDIERLQNIAQILNTDIHDLLGNTEEKGIELTGLQSEEKDLYKQIIKEKETYIERLEESLKFYRNIIRENNCI